MSAITHEEKVRWLRRYQDSLRREQELAEEVEQLRSLACKVTHALSGIPGGTSDDQALPRAVEQILEAQQGLQVQIEQCNIVRKEVIDAIEEVSDKKGHEILRRRYILGETWEGIAFHMHITLRWVYRLHKKVIHNDLFFNNSEF